MVNRGDFNPDEKIDAIQPDSRVKVPARKVLLWGTVSGVLLLALIGGVALLPQLVSSEKEVPDVVGQTRQVALESMASSGLTPEFLFEYDESVPEGEVFRVQPSPGERVEPEAEKVRIYISLGPEPIKQETVIAEPEPQWWPDGYFPLGSNVAFRWVDPTGDPCGRSACIFWRAEVVTKTGCPSGVYAKINILEGDNVVSWTNDTLAALSPDQVGKLTFTKYGMGNRGWNYEAEVVELNCR